MSKVKVKNIEKLADTKYLKLYSADYINKKGTLRNWTIASRKSIEDLNNKFFDNGEDQPDAVVIIAKHIEEDKLVLIRQFRVPINDYVIELPAGLVDEGENFIETVKRELKEETGLDLVKIDEERTNKKVYVSVGMTDESISLVYCTCSGNPSNENLEDDEDIEVILVSKEKAKEILKTEKNIDVKALLAIENYIK
ncbi:NUDIX hydrolase [Clostridium sartagoforme]|uniref:NUDIX hydrolase n=1 Tax=Clostridium sartagoforme TaxID=84031 RepID=A0A4S2DKH1_9CLOT|nr:NUDIX hydrolase [Clostridium sartagoforme]TGY42748.1 NUDIX hydrolase [Clostridium sartagoforme]